MLLVGWDIRKGPMRGPHTDHTAKNMKIYT